jgi:hypothetical protein
MLFGPLLLGADEQKIKNDKHQNQRDKAGETTGAATTGASCAHCICDIKQDKSSFRVVDSYFSRLIGFMLFLPINRLKKGQQKLC